MRILSQTNDIKGYHGTIGTPTNMYDYRGERLFVGDVVCLATFGVDGKKAYDFGIEFVCEENTDVSSWTGKNRQYVMGIASIYNKVKDHSRLAIGEKITFLSVVDVADRPTENGR